MDTPVEGTVICGAVAAECVCTLPRGHEPDPHICRDRRNCGGKWRGTIDADDFEVIRFPAVTPAERAAL